MINFNCFCIDLTPFKSASEIEEFLASINLQEFTDITSFSKVLYDIRLGRYTNSEQVTTVWLDSVTFGVVAFRTNSQSKFAKGYVEFINSITPIKHGDKFKQSTHYKKLTTIDEVLDKINESGLSSLNYDELKILKGQN